MIKFHYHRAQRDLPRLDVFEGDRMCHVYSDESLDELIRWGNEHGLRPEWIHHSSLPHFDAFGERLRICGEGVERRELVEDIRAWRRGERRPRE
ncbi:MAG: DUF4031 domain-containing protein [Gemmatimonadota bacterium]|nr:DUF4031 domain-containing protein [Gemmatimonadota bacterium]